MARFAFSKDVEYNFTSEKENAAEGREMAQNGSGSIDCFRHFITQNGEKPRSWRHDRIAAAILDDYLALCYYGATGKQSPKSELFRAKRTLTI